MTDISVLLWSLVGCGVILGMFTWSIVTYYHIKSKGFCPECLQKIRRAKE